MSGYLDPKDPSAIDRFNKRCEAIVDSVEQAGQEEGLHVVAARLIVSVDPLEGDGSTTLFDIGIGNLHAQIGAIEELLRKQRAYEHGYHAERGRRDYEELNER